MENQIMAYIKNRMCNLQLWGSSQEEVVYFKKIKEEKLVCTLKGISSGLKEVHPNAVLFFVVKMSKPVDCPVVAKSL